ncbi:MAG: hypothetical protein IJU20_02635 [Clostridia bacterium]|nr:hypothetical protein [Clostridia bacterium]
MDCGNRQKFEVYLLQHAHTDIGYTDSQDEIIKDHVRYIREVVRHAKEHPKDGYKWVCETFWGVEEFFKAAAEEEKEDFARAVKAGKIGISLSYLNLNESAQGDVISYATRRVLDLLLPYGIAPQYALTSDINGYAWGMADVLCDLGAKGLMSQLNSTHGREPFDHRQTPFIWESPRGQRLPVWIGEHYNQGNWCGLEPYLEETLEDALKRAEEQLPPYLQRLKESGYPYDFCPLGISGVFTDNAPPNFDVAELLELWNARHGDTIEVHMATLEDFFSRVREIEKDLPVVRGDWTDWWADGVGTTPGPLKLFREAQRMYHASLAVDPGRNRISRKAEDELVHNLMMYAEHTWGYYASVSEPWTSLSNEMDYKKTLYATLAHVKAKNLLMELLEPCGAARRLRENFRHFGVCNPLPHEVEVPLQFWVTYPQHFPKVNCLVGEDGRCFPADMVDRKLYAVVKVPAGSNYLLHAEYREGADAGQPLLRCQEDRYTTSRYELQIDKARGGIVSFRDLVSGRNLAGLYPDDPIFRPIYERTDAPLDGGSQCRVRGSLGYIRRNGDTRQYPAELCGVNVLLNTPDRAVLRLQYRMEGAKFVYTDLTFYRTLDRVDVNLILQKESEWSPEGVYLSLPFTGAEDTVYLDKTSCVIRPGMDQLPRACANFYLTQNGVAFVGPDGRYTSVYCADTPLIWMGRLDSTRVDEADGSEAQNRRPVYVWVMNNAWETNFQTSLAGFYDFAFTLRTGKGTKEEIFTQMKEEAELPLPYLHEDV